MGAPEISVPTSLGRVLRRKPRRGKTIVFTMLGSQRLGISALSTQMSAISHTVTSNLDSPGQPGPVPYLPSNSGLLVLMRWRSTSS